MSAQRVLSRQTRCKGWSIRTIHHAQCCAAGKITKTRPFRYEQRFSSRQPLNQIGYARGVYLLGLRGWRGIGLVHPLDDIDYKIIARTGLCEGKRVDVLYFDDCGVTRESRTKLLGAAVKCNDDKENHDSKEKRHLLIDEMFLAAFSAGGLTILIVNCMGMMKAALATRLKYCTVVDHQYRAQMNF